MPVNPRRMVVRAVAGRPVYRYLPEGSLRTYAALRYHAANSSPEQLARVVRALDQPSTRFYSAAMIATKAAFHAGQDELVEDMLSRLASRFPDASGLYELRSDLRAFQGGYEEALRDADRARFLEPSSTAAVARVVRLTYVVDDDEHADRVALTALQRFPRSSPVLWAVCKACPSGAQFERILATWREAAPPADVTAAVRQLATAAARAGRVPDAVDLFREAITVVQDRGEPPVEVKETRLEGRGAWSAIRDLCEVLDGAGVPFFFAAGTALGLVREGRPLDLDGDIDVGVFDRDFDRDRLVDLFREHPRFDFGVVHPQTKKLGLVHRGGSPVDIFRFYEEDGRVWHDAVFVRWHNAPFSVRRQEVQGLPVPLPVEHDRYLTENYGDWRTPHAGFDAFTQDAPNVELTWPDYLGLHLVRRAYRKLSTGDAQGAAQDLRDAQQVDLAELVGAAHG